MVYDLIGKNGGVCVELGNSLVWENLCHGPAGLAEHRERERDKNT